MSVINQMLIDLENRRAPATDRGPLGGHVRPLPDVASARVPTWVISAGAALVIGTLIGFGAHRWIPREAALDPQASRTNEVAVPSPPAPTAMLQAATVVEAAPAAAASDPAAAQSTASAAETAAPAIAEPTVHTPPPRRADAAATDSAAKSRKERDKDRSAKGKGKDKDKDKDKDRAGVAADRPAPASVVQVEPQSAVVAPAAPTAVAVAAVPVAAPLQAAASAATAKPASLFPGDLEVKVSPAQRVENEHRQALNALAQGRTTEAQELLLRVLASTPLHDGARHALLGLLLRERKPGAAEALADDRLARDPDHPGFAQISARLKLDRGDLQAALATLTRTMPHAHASAEFLAFRAAVLQRLARHGEAVEDYSAALKLQPQTAVWNMGLAISLQALERRTDALDAFRRARSGAGLAPELQAYVDQRVRQLERP
jgi:MSHA biogenesis protein MshN